MVQLGSLCGQQSNASKVGTGLPRGKLFAQINVVQEQALLLWPCLGKHVHLPTSKCSQASTSELPNCRLQLQSGSATHAADVLAQSPKSNALWSTLTLHCFHNHTLTSPTCVTRKLQDALSPCRIMTKLAPAWHSSSDFKLQNFIPKLRKWLVRCYLECVTALWPQVFHISYDSALSTVTCCAYL